MSVAGDRRSDPRLGALLGEYQSRPGSGLWLLIPFTTLIFGIMVTLIVTGALTLPSGSGVMLLTIGLFLAIWIAWMFVGRALRQDRWRRVSIYERGFTCIRWRLVVNARWDSVASITQRDEDSQSYGWRQPPTTSRSYRLRLKSGRALAFGESLGDVYEMGELMQRAITQAQETDALAALRRGETLRFGALSLNSVGIALGDRTLPWNKVAGASMRRWAITVTQTGAPHVWAVTRDRQTPNARLFVALVTAMLARERAAAPVKG